MQEQPNYIALQIKNNSNFPVSVNLLGGPFNPSDANSPTKLYTFDISTETWAGVKFATLDYTVVSSGSPVSIQQLLPENTVAGVVEVLNKLGIGLWNYQGYIIYYSSNDYIITQLDIS